MAFNEILQAIANTEKSLEQIDKQLEQIDKLIEEADKEREGGEQERADIIRRRAALGPNGAGNGDTTLARITDLVRRYGPMAAKRFGIPGAIGAGAAALLADNDAYAGIIAAISSLFRG